MKYLLIILLTISLSCRQKQNETTVRIYSVDVDIETIFSIKCNDFLDTFDSTELKTKDVIEKSTVDDFQVKLKTLQLDSGKRDPDTRAIIILKNEVTTDTLCADRFTIKYRDKYYTMTVDLLKIIWSE